MTVNRIKIWIVNTLERLCHYLDNGRPFTRCWLANWSARLDERWNTKQWRTYDDEPKVKMQNIARWEDDGGTVV